eukprot:TRINITY_DN2991_c0_g1_i1.p1 TRINITY_DN2991_c0_g1~~TRINITY_DN2991_c0_g1_i1.p1  ORF type:complete len:589 (-),score=118.04 TRINITY_DN2991_c0_g1_i1:117-1796(-)
MATSSEEKQIPAFIWKLYNMVEDVSSSHCITWSAGGHSFLVTSPSEFQEVILPKFFKHSNFSSFVRQLNLYGFHKVGEPHFWEFQHESFLRGNKSLLKHIKRRAGGNVEKAQAAVHEEIHTLTKDKDQLLVEMREMHAAHNQAQERMQSMAESYDVMWKQLTLAHQQYIDMQARMRRVSTALVQMFLPEEDVSSNGKRRRPAAEGMRQQSVSDLHRTSFPYFGTTSLTNLRQISDKSLLGLLARKGSFASFRGMSMTDIRQQLSSMPDFGNLLNEALPPIAHGSGAVDEDFEMWMKELQDSGVVDADGNPVNIVYSNPPAVSTAGPPGAAALPAVSTALPGLMETRSSKRGREDEPNTANLRRATNSQADLGTLRNKSTTGSMASLSGLLAAANVVAQQQTGMPSQPQTSVAGMEGVNAAAPIVTSTGVHLPPHLREQLRAIAADLRADDRTADHMPMLSPQDMQIIQTVTIDPRDSASHAPNTRSHSSGFDRVHALTNELISEVSRVCAQQNLQETLAQVTNATMVGVYVARSAIDPHAAAPAPGTGPKEPTAILLFK